MPDMPNVPNWLQWVAASAVPLGILWGGIRWLWRRILSDLWAKRTRGDAEVRAAILIRQFREAMDLNDNDNDRRFQAISATVMSNLILGSLMMVIGGGVILIPDKISDMLVFIGSILVFLGFVTMIDAIEKRQRFIMPFTDWDKYFDRTIDRIGSLLTKAGLSDEEQAEFIDSIVVDVAEEESNPPGESDE